MKFGLGLHTTTGELGICLNNFQGEKKFNSWDLGRDLANNLHECLAEFINPLTWQDVEFIAVAKGPGSYTSTRIGIVTARTLAQQLAIPVYGISTLMSLAYYEQQKNDSQSEIIIEMKANQTHIFAGIYQFIKLEKAKIILEDQLMEKERWQEKLKIYQEQFNQEYLLIKSPEKLAFTTPALLNLANLQYKQEQKTAQFSTWQNLLPFY